MKKALVALLLSTVAATPALARDSTLHLPFQEVVDAGIASGKLDGTVKFYLAGTGPKGGKVLDSSAVTNKKTNSFGKSDEKACSWAALSALISLQEAAKQAGANMVTDIVSDYKKVEYRNSANYECHAGAVIAGVALKAKLVKH
jgi:uncharacterized protein YbjQ (UPF0145 family)